MFNVITQNSSLCYTDGLITRDGN